MKREKRSLRGGVECGGKLVRRGPAPVIGKKAGNGWEVGEGVGRVAGRILCEGECPGGRGKKFFVPVNEGRWGAAREAKKMQEKKRREGCGKGCRKIPV